MNIVLASLNAKFIHSSLALRYIKAYCKNYEEHIKILEMTINHEEDQVIQEIFHAKPDVLAFSCYIWNMVQIKKLIPTLRKILPNTKIILGGPEVSYKSEKLFDTLAIDAVMEGEGEETWAQYLDYMIEGKGKLETIDGLVYKKNEQVFRNKARKPLEMAKLPFVYHNMIGLEHKILYYEASRGCPFNCQYCLSSIDKGVRLMPIERVKTELQYFLDTKVPQVKFVDRTFNTNKQFARDIWQYIIDHDNGETNFHFEIAAELLDDDSINLLKAAREGLIQFEIGVQSTNMEVLQVIRRPMPFEKIAVVVNKVKALKTIHQHLDLIAGLPLEDYQSFKKSFNDVISLRPEQFQLGFLKLLRGSGLRDSAKEYGIVYKDEPPYEVLYTKHISYEELVQLHAIEEMVERYYNSGRFNSSMEYLYTFFPSVFDCYEALAHFWQEQGYDKIQHKKQAYYLKLLEFAEKIKDIKINLMKEIIRFDWYMHELIKDLPEELVTISQAVYKEEVYQKLKDTNFIEAVSKKAAILPTKQRVRKMHIEYFIYDIACAYQKNDYSHIKENQEARPILFDYTEKVSKRCYAL